MNVDEEEEYGWRSGEEDEEEDELKTIKARARATARVEPVKRKERVQGQEEKE